MIFVSQRGLGLNLCQLFTAHHDPQRILQEVRPGLPKDLHGSADLNLTTEAHLATILVDGIFPNHALATKRGTWWYTVAHPHQLILESLSTSEHI